MYPPRLNLAVEHQCISPPWLSCTYIYVVRVMQGEQLRRHVGNMSPQQREISSLLLRHMMHYCL